VAQALKTLAHLPWRPLHILEQLDHPHIFMITYQLFLMDSIYRLCTQYEATVHTWVAYPHRGCGVEGLSGNCGAWSDQHVC
jgi:hypothetical protein